MDRVENHLIERLPRVARLRLSKQAEPVALVLGEVLLGARRSSAT